MSNCSLLLRLSTYCKKKRRDSKRFVFISVFKSRNINLLIQKCKFIDPTKDSNKTAYQCMERITVREAMRHSI